MGNCCGQSTNQEQNLYQTRNKLHIDRPQKDVQDFTQVFGALYGPDYPGVSRCVLRFDKVHEEVKSKNSQEVTINFEEDVY